MVNAGEVLPLSLNEYGGDWQGFEIHCLKYYLQQRDDVSIRHRVKFEQMITDYENQLPS